jgi:hypothetical protein
MLATTMLMGLAIVTPANANLVLFGGTVDSSFVDLGATGFGDAHRLITLQTTPFESGSVTPVNVTSGDAISGADKSTTPTLSALGWASGANVGIGLDTNQTGGSGITLDTLVLTVYAANGTTVLGTFSLASPVNFSAAQLAMQQGNGNSIFDFVLNATEQAQFNAIVALPGSGSDFAALSSSLGCAGTPSPTCQVSNDGADSFLGFNQAAAVPGPIAGAGIPGIMGLLLLGFARLRQKRFFWLRMAQASA